MDWVCAWAHPRSRGENLASEGESAQDAGSPPLTRGKRQQAGLTLDVLGLIPAHAGKTTSSSASPTTRRAHPRSRGENTSWTRRPAGATGSSPLTRGKPRLWVGTRARGRLIPAHAGKTTTSTRDTKRSRAHPRSRGENRMGQVRAASGVGSSPLTRGKPIRKARSGRFEGLIPAHAGKTADGERIEIHDGAHPRSRGENRRLADEVEQA